MSSKAAQAFLQPYILPSADMAYRQHEGCVCVCQRRYPYACNLSASERTYLTGIVSQSDCVIGDQARLVREQ